MNYLPARRLRGRCIRFREDGVLAPDDPRRQLARLSPRHRMRKMALVLGEVERELLLHLWSQGGALSRPSFGTCWSWPNSSAPSPRPARALRHRLLHLAMFVGGIGQSRVARNGARRAVDGLRHALFAATGQAPADWDLLDPSTGLPDPGSRQVFPGESLPRGPPLSLQCRVRFSVQRTHSASRSSSCPLPAPIPSIRGLCGARWGPSSFFLEEGGLGKPSREISRSSPSSSAARESRLFLSLIRE